MLGEEWVDQEAGPAQVLLILSFTVELSELVKREQILLGNTNQSW